MQTARLGVIVPSVNTVVEAWYPNVVPDGVSLHFARMLIGEGTGPERIVEMDRTDGARAIRQIASCRPHAVAYGCTASSIVQGHAYDAHLRQEIQAIAGAPATTATSAIFAACRALGIARAISVSPYPEAVDRAERQFFAEGGVETIGGAHFDIADGFGLADPDGDMILDRAVSAWDPAADGTILACLNFRSHLVIDALEARTGKPVVTSTQAVLWQLLRLAGITAPISGCGRLLRQH